MKTHATHPKSAAIRPPGGGGWWLCDPNRHGNTSSTYADCKRCKKLLDTTRCMVHGCSRKATRWDGGMVAVVMTEQGQKPAYPMFMCSKHDSGHNLFDLPDNFKEAMTEIRLLRGRMQELWHRYLALENDHARLKNAVKESSKLP